MLTWGHAVQIATALTLPERYALTGLGMFPTLLRDPTGDALPSLARKGLCDEYGLTPDGCEVIAALNGVGPKRRSSRRRRVPLAMSDDARIQFGRSRRQRYDSDTEVIDQMTKQTREVDALNAVVEAELELYSVPT